jgi:hypothetical protein
MIAMCFSSVGMLKKLKKFRTARKGGPHALRSQAQRSSRRRSQEVAQFTSYTLSGTSPIGVKHRRECPLTSLPERGQRAMLLVPLLCQAKTSSEQNKLGFAQPAVAFVAALTSARQINAVKAKIREPG